MSDDIKITVIFILAILIAGAVFLWGEYGRFFAGVKNTYNLITVSPNPSGGIINPADAIPKSNPLSGSDNPIKNIYSPPK